ncbi:MAG: Bax inhibitor-1/YccA family protein [Alphaproteobacteria bacterium]|nr:Bax inhibitor-1/YccA family protein [Alphaproteobacteria bacterium]
MNFDMDRETVISSRGETVIDAGLRSYMMRVYNYMTFGLLITTFISFGLAHSSAIDLFYTVQNHQMSPTGLGWIAMLSPLAIVFMFAHSVRTLNVSATTILFMLYSALTGVSLSTIFFVYAGADIFRVFLITSIMFLGTSLYGYTTRKNLATIGGYMVMCIWGLIVASIVNIFLKSTGMDFMISVVGVLVFTALTAWDTQKIRMMYLESDSDDVGSVKAISGAFELYLDFINLFLYLLRLFAGRNRD